VSLRKLCFFAMLATIVASFALAGRVDVHVKKFDLPTPNPPLHDPALTPDESRLYVGQSADKPSQAQCAQTFRTTSELLPAVFAPVQSKNVKDLGTGKLLVASRNLGDPNFAKTVVLLVHYDEDGVLGLVLNRRTHLPLSQVLAELEAAKDRSDPIYLGGPVETPRVFALLQSRAKIAGADHVFGIVYLISSKTLFEQTISARPDPNVFHVYLGYAGWDQDQLQKEVEMGSWFIFPADAGTVFSVDPDSLWLQMIKETELKMAGSEPAGADHRTHMYKTSFREAWR